MNTKIPSTGIIFGYGDLLARAVRLESATDPAVTVDALLMHRHASSNEPGRLATIDEYNAAMQNDAEFMIGFANRKSIDIVIRWLEDLKISIDEHEAQDNP